MHIAIINGPNLNLLGFRQPEVYGNVDWNKLEARLVNEFRECNLIFKQSNHEGEIIDWIQQYGMPGKEQCEGIILNAGGYSHTSVAIADAVASVKTPVISVHISNIYAREVERHRDLLSAYVAGGVFGLGPDVYRMAVDWFLRNRATSNS